MKACLLGCNSATLNAQVTFVNIAVAISALAGGGGGGLLKFSHRASISLVFSRCFDDLLGLEIKTVLRSNFGSFWCLCGSNFGSFWWLSGAIPTRVHSKNFAPGPYIAGVFAFFDDFLRLEIKTVLRSNFGSFWCLCGSNFGSFWWLSGAIPTRGHSKNFAPGPYIAGVFAVFRRFFGVGDQDGTEIEFWVLLVLLWTEFWVILVALWCNSYSCEAFKSGKRMKNTYWEEPHRWKKRGCYSTKK